jgi:hypothetical protein
MNELLDKLNEINLRLINAYKILAEMKAYIDSVKEVK